MREPPPIVESPHRLAWLFISAALLILLACYSEFGTSPAPVVPASQVPGFIFICLGAAVGCAILDRYRPNVGYLIYFVLAVPILFQVASQHTSALPILLYAGVFQLSRAALLVGPIDFD